MEIKKGNVIQSSKNPKQWGKIRDVSLATNTIIVTADPESALLTGITEFQLHVSDAQAYVKATA